MIIFVVTCTCDVPRGRVLRRFEPVHHRGKALHRGLAGLGRGKPIDGAPVRLARLQRPHACLQKAHLPLGRTRLAFHRGHPLLDAGQLPGHGRCLFLGAADSSGGKTVFKYKLAGGKAKAPIQRKKLETKEAKKGKAKAACLASRLVEELGLGDDLVAGRLVVLEVPEALARRARSFLRKAALVGAAVALASLFWMVLVA